MIGNSNKFRKERKALSVYTKLPPNSILPTMDAVCRYVVPHSGGQFGLAWKSPFDKECYRLFQNYNEYKELCFVKSAKPVVKVMGDTLMVSVGFLLELVKFEKYDRRRTEDSNIQRINLKMLDIIAFVSESSTEVVKISLQKSDVDANRYGFARCSAPYRNRVKFPYLSKRFEKTSFYSKAKSIYKDCITDLQYYEWGKDLDWIKLHPPLKVLMSEHLSLKKELEAHNDK